jgi:hypothetical protein
VAHYWDGAAPAAHTIRDISANGLYLLTEQRWYPGTLVMMTLQRKDSFDGEADRSITVQSKVVRSGADGVGLAFIAEEHENARPAGGSSLDENQFFTAGRKAINKFLQRVKNGRADAKGQSLVEFILILPVVFLLVVNVVNFGAFFYAWITVSNAARAGADYAIMSLATVGSPIPPTAAQITSLITTDILSLPNRASLNVKVCQNFDFTITGTGSGCSSYSDPEPTNYVLTVIDVTYTYQPLIPAGFQFRSLNVYATIPSTTIHRQAVMRVEN